LGRWGGCVAGRRGPADGRRLHPVSLVAPGVRRRGGRRARDPGAHATDGRHPRRVGCRARHGRDRSLRPRAGAGRVRHPAFGRVGLRAAEAGTTRVARALPGRPARPRPGGAVGVVGGGGGVLRLFLAWENHRLGRGDSALIDPAMLRNRTLRGGLTAFFFQYLLQAGLFFAVPLFLSVALGLSAIATGVRLLPLSITLLLVAVGVPRLFPGARPRRGVRVGFLALVAGTVVMVAALDAGAGPELVTWPMLLAGAGIGALASQLGAVTVSSVPDEQSGEVGGLQNPLTNLGASIGTAFAGAVLISALTASFFSGIRDNPDVPKEVSSKAQV